MYLVWQRTNNLMKNLNEIPWRKQGVKGVKDSGRK